MLALKQLLRWSFALAAITLFPATIGVAARFLRAGNLRYPLLTSGIFASLLAVALLFALACWTTRKPRATRSPWAIAASLLSLATGIAFLRYSYAPITFTSPELLLIAAGIAGVIVFSRRETVPDPATATAKLPRIPGDRTSPWVDHAVTALFCLAAYAASRFWSAWSSARDLPSASTLRSVALILLAILATSALHELGHATVAWAFKMRLLSFNAGPFQWRKREGKWSFKFQASGLVSLGGAVSVVPTNYEQPRWHDVCMIAAGPCANICIGVFALWATLHAQTAFYEPSWEFLARLTSFCFIAAILNLFPFRAEGGAYSDGARILQLLTNSPVAALHRAIIGVQTTLVTPRRPRDFDAAALQQTATRFRPYLAGLQLHLCASQSYEDSGRLPEARAALAAAEAIYHECKIDLPAPLHTAFIYGHASLNRDAAAARQWWERMQAKKLERRTVDYWLARTALLSIEGRLAEAAQAWQKADIEAAKLPEFGAYQYDRDRCSRLREELDQASPATELQPQVLPPRSIPRPRSQPYGIFGVNPATAIAD